MINASGPSNTPLSASTPSIGNPAMPPAGQMPQAGAGVPTAAPTQSPVLPTQPISATTPPAAGNSAVGSSSGNGLQKPKKKLPWKIIAGTVVLLLIMIGGIAGYFLTQTSQDVRQQAAGSIYNEGSTCSTEGEKVCGSTGKILQCGGFQWRPTGETCKEINKALPKDDGQLDSGDPIVYCYATQDKCQHKTVENCLEEENFSNPQACGVALNTQNDSTSKGCYTTKNKCIEPDTTYCSSSPSFETFDRCRDAFVEEANTGGGIGCYTTKDKCVSQAVINCSSEPAFGTLSSCTAVLSGKEDTINGSTGGSVGCFTSKDNCGSQAIINCSSNPSFGTIEECNAAIKDSGSQACTLTQIKKCQNLGGACVITGNAGSAECQNATSGEKCQKDTQCQINGGTLVCSAGKCVQPSNQIASGGTNTQNTSTDADGTGSCAACLGLGGQAERDCYAQCSGTVATGICAGLSADQCQQTCSQSGGSNQVCTGSQEGAGTARAGEFLSCGGASSTNGCGQVDCLDNSGSLIGFVIDNSQCSSSGGTGGTTNTSTTTTKTLDPKLASCNQGCSKDNNCADANHSCVEGKCRLSTYPDSANCTEPSGATPTPVPQPSPTPVPTISPDLASCNETCSSSADCADLNHSCQSSVCRLTSYPDSENCTEPSGETPPPVPRTPETPLQCNDPCSTDNDCSSFNHVCHNSRCRLSTNLDNISCTEAVVYQSSTTDLGQINQQPETPTTLPSAGATDLKNWLLTGLGAVGVGALILLLL